MMIFLLWFWIIAGSIHLGFWIFIFSKTSFLNFKSSKKLIDYPSVSVIVCFKNESSTIVKTIQSILDQSYPQFEVIAVDDFSADDSADLVKKISDHRLKCIQASVDKPGKKQALKDGILKAENDILLVTDADCTPASSFWISRMTEEMEKAENQIVLGFSPLNDSGGFISRFARFEALMTALQYISYTLSGMPYMGVGRNMMFRKTLFEKIMEDETYYKHISGDDDLMVNKLADRKNTALCLHPESWVYTDAEVNVSQFIQQKLRHISVSVSYKRFHQFLLVLFGITYIAFYVLLGVLIFLKAISFFTAIIVLMLKWVIQNGIQYRFFKETRSLKYWFQYPFWDICLVLYLIILVVLSVAGIKTSWKGQAIKTNKN